jgi:hypothetical protein
MKNTLLVLCAAIAFAASAAEPVGHWKLNEKEGETVADSSAAKNNGKAVGAPARSEEKGGAFTLNGKDQYVEIPSSKTLDDLQKGSFTICAWFKAADAPAGTEDANNANYGIVLKTGWHMGIYYTNEKKFAFAYFLKGDPDVVWKGTGTWDTEYEPGQWHHVAAVVDAKDRVCRIYVDGEKKSESEAWDEKDVSRDYGNMTWKIGVGSPGAEKWSWSAKGSVGDVRLFNVALKDEEIKAVADELAKK